MTSGARRVGVCVAAAVAASGCRAVVYQTFGFRSVEARSGAGVVVSAVLEGRATSIDSAGARYDRVAAPYWIALYVSGARIGGVEADFTPASSPRTIRPRFAGPEALSDPTTVVFVADSVALPFEDHDVVVRLWSAPAGDAPTDSVSFRLEKRRDERRTSLWEWLGNI